MREDRSSSARYVSPDVVGYEDLDEYGGWRPVPEYGTVWFPHTTVVGWAPYRYGHWVYIAPWGYTWVEDEPWGYAPFHYGRWVTVGGVWGWVPAPPQVVGVVYVRPVYAPALVAWVGGPHFGVAVGSNVGWFPLGPREVYVPSYPVSRRYCETINVTNTRVERIVVNNYYTTVVVNKQVNVTNVTYVNQRSVTATSGTTFVSGQNVSRNVVRVDQREIVQTRVVVRRSRNRSDAPNLHRRWSSGRRSSAGHHRHAHRRRESSASTRSGFRRSPGSRHQGQRWPPDRSHPISPTRAASNAGRSRRSRWRSAQQRAHRARRPHRHADSTQAGQHRRPPRSTRPTWLQQQRPAPRSACGGQPPVNNNAPRPGQPLNNGQPVNNAANPNAPRPNQPTPGVTPQNQNPNQTQTSAPAGNNRNFNNRPPNDRPNNVPVANPQVQQQQQQQLERLRAQQDAERQKLEQQQVQQQQKVQSQPNPNPQKVQQLNQKQTQQLQNMERKHDTQAQTLQNRQNNQVVPRGANPNQNNKAKTKTSQTKITASRIQSVTA